VKSAKQFIAVVERQDPAIAEKAQFIVVGRAKGTYEECWKLAKDMVKYPVLRFKEIHNVSSTV